MNRDLSVIDSDGHVMEPADLWGGPYMDPKFRELGPVRSPEDSRLYFRDGTLYPYGRSFGLENVSPDSVRLRPGGRDPKARVEDLDLDGIDAAVLYPTVGSVVGFVSDPELSAAMVRAYNRWLAEFTSYSPERLIGSALIPVQSVDHAIAELRFACDELGFRTANVRPQTYDGRTIHSREWDPFWAAAQDLDCPIGFHGSSAWPWPQAGEERFGDDELGPAKHIVVHPFEQQLALVGLMQAGVFERFPRLRVAFLESGGGWIVPLLERLERHYDQQWSNDATTVLPQRPWDYFRQNCWISFEPVEQSIALLADFIGPDKILWATDYPHADGFFPGAPQMLAKILDGVSEETRAGVFSGGAKAFYDL